MTQPRGGLAVTPGKGQKSQEYRAWLAALIRHKQHQAAFVRALTDDTHDHFMAATKHAAAYAEGLPVQPTIDLTPQERKAAPVIAILAALGDPKAMKLLSQDPETGARVRMLQAIETEATLVE